METKQDMEFYKEEENWDWASEMCGGSLQPWPLASGDKTVGANKSVGSVGSNFGVWPGVVYLGMVKQCNLMNPILGIMNRFHVYHKAHLSLFGNKVN